MKKYFLLLAAFLLVNVLMCQKSWSWGIQTEIGISGQKVHEQNDQAFGNTSYSYIFFRERQATLGGGLWVKYQLGKRIGLRSGIQYAYIGEKNGSSSFNEIISTKQQTSYYYQSYTIRVHQLQIPLMVELRLSKGKIQPIIGVGIAYNEEWVAGVTEKSYNINLEQMVESPSQGFPSNTRERGVQPILSLGFAVNEQLTIEVNHKFAKEDIFFTWSPDIDSQYSIDPSIIYCGIGYIHHTQTRYRNQTSLAFKYGF